MAQKGQKFNNYSYQEKIKIIDEYYNVGGSTYSLAKNIIYQDQLLEIGLNYTKKIKLFLKKK